MDRAAVEELFSFTDYAWRRYENVLRPLGDEVLAQPVVGSGWPALRDALSHMTWAYARWLADPAGTSGAPEVHISSWDELEGYRRRVWENVRAYLDSLSDDELVTPREMNVDGDVLVYSPAEIFAHAMLHERQHHGDVNTLLSQLGIEIPIVEFRFSLAGRGL
jgi:uncharacterized damage-inducible protein DinB